MPNRFDACIVLNYFWPHTSGLTKVASDIAEAMTDRGWRVAVVASRHDSDLPRHEVRGLLEIFRAPVLARIGRGVISPGFARLARRVGRDSAVVNLHLPMLEAGPVAAVGATPIVSHHHDDVWLSSRGPLASAQIAVVERSVAAALRRSAAVVVNNLDHGEHSRHWPVMRRTEVHAIPPACTRRGPGLPKWRETAGPHVGFLGRMAPEKGLHRLIAAFRHWPDPDARLLLAGEDRHIAGGGVVDDLMAEAAGDERVRFLGRIEEEDIGAFHGSIDAFALPSLAEESFGITQTEAMMSGVPVVASDLPGMRIPVRTTGFGEIVDASDAAALAGALRRVCRYSAERRAEGAAAAVAAFDREAVLDRYVTALDAASRRA